MGSSVLTPGDGDPPTPLGLRARARPPGAKSPFYLLPETGGAGPPGPPCVWGVGGCVQSMRVCVCVCVCARAVVTAPRWAALVHVCERKWSWLCLLSCPAPQGLTPAAPRPSVHLGPRARAAQHPLVPAWPPAAPWGGATARGAALAALSHVGFMFACLFVFVLIQIYFIFGLETFRHKRTKKIKRGWGVPAPTHLGSGGVCVPDPRLGPTHPCGRAARVRRKGTGGQVGAGLPTCAQRPRVRGPPRLWVGGHWAQA